MSASRASQRRLSLPEEGEDREVAARVRFVEGNDSSDGSELDSSDGDSDVEAPAPAAIPRDRATMSAMTAEALTMAETPGQARACDSDGARHTKHKRARTNYGVSARERPDGEWRSDDDVVEIGPAPGPAMLLNVGGKACDDDRVTSGSVARVSARPRTVTTTTEYGETVVLQEGETGGARETSTKAPKTRAKTGEPAKSLRR